MQASRSFAWLIVVLVALIVGAAAAEVSAKEIMIVLQVEPELDLDGTERIYVGPIMVEPRAEQSTQLES